MARTRKMARQYVWSRNCISKTKKYNIYNNYLSWKEEKMKCVFCNGILKKSNVEYKEQGISLGKFRANVCTKCGEAFFEPEIVDKIQIKSKKLGLFGLKANVKIAKIGNSLAVRIPKKIAEFLKLKQGEETAIYPQGHKLIIEAS